MARRRFLPFGKSPVDLMVFAFLNKKGIDINDLQGYTISRSTDDIGTITLAMIFDEEIMDPGDVRKYMVGESGPELVLPDEESE